MQRAILLISLLTLGICVLHAQTVTDIDGNVYNTVTIGTQTWMEENLKTTRYNDDSGIPAIIDSTAWSTSTLPGYCWYSNTSLYKDNFGALYNWFAVSTGKLAPEGWHVATDGDWKVLTDFLGGEATAGGKLKDVGTITIGTGYWYSPNTGATNQSGFSAFGCGARELDGSFNYLFSHGFWWTASSDSNGFALYRQLTYNYPDVIRGYLKAQDGLSVRCVKDTEPGVEDPGKVKMLKIFPNPAKDFIFIECSENNPVDIEVFNFTGRRIMYKTGYYAKDKIDIRNLSAGVYFITITGPAMPGHFKLILD